MRKRELLCTALLLGGLLAGCAAATAADTAEPTPAEPVQAVPTPVTVEPISESPPPEPEPQPLFSEPGAPILLFGAWSETRTAADGTLLVDGAAFAAGMGLDYAETEDAAELRREAARLRFPLYGEFATAARQDGVTWIPAVRAAERFGAVQGVTEDGTVYFARVPELAAPTANVKVPILMYHAVSDDLWGYWDLFVSPHDLEAQLQYLADNGYETIWFEDLSHLEDYEKPVILTFDDGYDDNYTELFPLLQQYQAKATIFVIARDIGGSHKLDAAQIQELAASGLVSIQSHTYSHGNLSLMDEPTLEREMALSQSELAALTGQVPYVVCYPEGNYSELTIEVARRYYAYGLLMNGYVYNTLDDPFRVQRMYIPRGQTSIEWNVRDAGTSDPWR